MTIREEAFAGKPLSCPVIDAHTHICAYHLSGWHQRYSHTKTEVVLEDMEKLGVDCIVTSPHPMVQERMEEANEIAAKESVRFPGKVYGYITVVPPCGMERIKEQLNRYAKHPGFVGVKFLTGYHGDFNQPEYQYALDFADEMSCPVLLHVWGGVPSAKDCAKALETRHNLKLVVAHQGGGYAENTRSFAPMIREYENAYMELCGSMDNRLPVEMIVDLVGEDKVIYGTDAISLDPKYEFGRVAFSPLKDQVKEKIFAGNFLRLLETSQMGKINL
ncbi:MAG: amidohydrolase [Roseburia sp.]|nr:amidohydrolase [Roseburia sp.]